jgi:hypothetical protein
LITFGRQVSDELKASHIGHHQKFKVVRAHLAMKEQEEAMRHQLRG